MTIRRRNNSVSLFSSCRDFLLWMNFRFSTLLLTFSVPLILYGGIILLFLPRLNLDSNLKFNFSPIMASPTTSPSGPSIIYKLVEEYADPRSLSPETSSYMRYGAFYNEDINNQRPVTVFEWAQAIATSESARHDFITTLSQNTTPYHYEAYYFETKGCSHKNYKHKSFEFVLVNAPRLLSFVRLEGPNVRAFQTHFDNTSGENSAIAFYNLGGDAKLVVPKPSNDKNNNLVYYSHLATFVRNIPNEHQISELIRMVAEEYLKLLNEQDSKTIWLSTSGTGISWLHFRLDTTPKYYQYQKFAQET